MLRPSPSARRKSLFAALAVSAALAGLAPAAHAQAPAAAARPVYTPAFVTVYQPLANIVNAETGDFAAAKAQLPAVLAAMASADDRSAAGNLVLLLGNKLKDRALQRQGLELMLASGKVTPAQVGQFNFFVGNLAYEANDFPAALKALDAARAAGFVDENLPGLLAETYFKTNQVPAGLDYLKGEIVRRVAAGTPPSETWIRRGLQVAYDGNMTAQANEWSALLVTSLPTTANWTTALQVVNAVNPLDAQSQLDLLRLMALTNAMSERADYVRYIEAADPRVMSNEVAKVLQAGVTAGALKTNDTYYQEVKRVVDQRAAADRAEAPRMVAQAQRAGANVSDALNAGDVLYSLGQYAEAEKMYALAVQKGGSDRDRALTRLGITQVQQGRNAEAKANFAQITAGTRAPVARMWEAYIQSKG